MAARPVAGSVTGVSAEAYTRARPARLGGVRFRWFLSGLIIGVVAGTLFALGISLLAVTQVPAISDTFAGEPDLAMTISESYLNREAQRRVGNGYPTGISGLTLTGLTLDLKPGNRMDLQSTFNLKAFLVEVDFNAAVSNNLTVRDGELVMNMVGDPQLGNLNVPLNFLPFDLKGEVTNAIDTVNNELLIAEINRSLETGFGGSDFYVEGVTTNDSGMIIRLKQQR